MTFKSAVDWWYYVIVLVTSGAALLAVVPVIGTGRPGSIVFGATLLLVTAGLPLWLLFTTEYEIAQQMLKIRSGPFRWSIPVASISSVADSHSVISSPALSLRRLKVSYGRGKTILVSPADRDGFLAAIARR